MSAFPAGALRRSCALLVLAILTPVSLRAQSARPGPSKPARAAASTAQGVGAFYTSAQALRGEKVFAAQCASCHARKDMSSADFHLKWNGRTVYDLLERVQTTMPESDPGGLSVAQYTDVVAYLLKLNGMPAGKVAVAPGVALKQQKLAMTVPR